MNNFTFGDDSFGYYETIAGGSGAGPTWKGTSGVQCHMTNTRMTDVEVMERRYPVLVKQFSIRRGSGGTGLHRGGDGIVREIQFLRDGITASLLCERRVLRPPGLAGGGSGALGQNTLRRVSGKVVNIGGKNRVSVNKNDVITILTPGGGGYGEEGPTCDCAGAAVDSLLGTRTASTALGTNSVDF